LRPIPLLASSSVFFPFEKIENPPRFQYLEELRLNGFFMVLFLFKILVRKKFPVLEILKIIKLTH